MATKALRSATTLLGYDGCSTCKKAKKWLADNGVECTYRAITAEPPTVAELSRWIPESGLPVKKWLNTSGQSYRALGKEAIDGATEETLRRWLSEDGKLVKRPVLVTEGEVLVGFKEEDYARVLSRRASRS